MPPERRDSFRIRGPFDATWSGSAGNRTVRISDFSIGGCFVEDIAVAAVGEHVHVTLKLPGDKPLEASGRVVYLYPGQGFAVAFDQDERVASALQAAVRRLSAARASGD
jgi:hypothetical protein